MASSEESQAVIGCHSGEDWKKHITASLESKKLVVVDFTASWCGPCRVIAPVFAELAKKFPHIVFLKVDVDELKKVAEEHNVEAMPTFLFLKEGKEVDRIVGASKDTLQQKVASLGAITA